MKEQGSQEGYREKAFDYVQFNVGFCKVDKEHSSPSCSGGQACLISPANLNYCQGISQGKHGFGTEVGLIVCAA